MGRKRTQLELTAAQQVRLRKLVRAAGTGARRNGCASPSKPPRAGTPSKVWPPGSGARAPPSKTGSINFTPGAGGIAGTGHAARNCQPDCPAEDSGPAAKWVADRSLADGFRGRPLAQRTAWHQTQPQVHLLLAGAMSGQITSGSWGSPMTSLFWRAAVARYWRVII